MAMLDEIKNLKGQKYLFLNVRSLCKQLTDIQADFQDSTVTCLGITESWLGRLHPDDLVRMDGFSIARLDRQISKKGGGVLMYINDNAEWSLLPDSSVSDANIEVLSVIITRKYQKKLCISTVYIPPLANIELSIDKLDTIGSKVSELGFDWIVGGDFNIDIMPNKTNPGKKLMNNFASRNSLQQVIKDPTRSHLLTASLIDHMLMQLIWCAYQVSSNTVSLTMI